MYYGIDFGTTNSACIGITDAKSVLQLGDTFDGRPFPSLVIIDPHTGQVWTGREAWEKRQQFKNECIVISSVKSLMGTNKTWTVAGQIWNSSMVAAQVLCGLKENARETGDLFKLEEAVVAVPVRFTPAQRADLRTAAQIAGIKIKSIVSEPTAAFFRHYQEIKGYQRIGVFDWGGGTLDIAILENIDGNVREVAVDGIQLGGDNIDSKLAYWFHDQVLQQKGGTRSFREMDAADRDAVLVRCERAKIDLGSRARIDIGLTSYGSYGPVKIRIDEDIFSRLITPEVNRAIETFENLLNNYNMSIEEIGCILMVGGSVNLKPFIDAVKERWKDSNIINPPDSDWSVASGAAQLNMHKGEYVLAESIGIILADDNFYPLLQDGIKIDVAKSDTSFALVEDSNTANFIFAYKSGEILGYMNVPSMGFFKEKIDLVCEIGPDMVLEVKAKSQNRSPRYSERWYYPGPRIFYKLPLGFEGELHE